MYFGFEVELFITRVHTKSPFNSVSSKIYMNLIDYTEIDSEKWRSLG